MSVLTIEGDADVVAALIGNDKDILNGRAQMTVIVNSKERKFQAFEMSYESSCGYVESNLLPYKTLRINETCPTILRVSLQEVNFVVQEELLAQESVRKAEEALKAAQKTLKKIREGK